MKILGIGIDIVENKRIKLQDDIFFASETPNYGEFHTTVFNEQFKLVQIISSSLLEVNVENKLFISINGTKLYATPEEDVDRTDNSGKTSSVHFIHFKFSDKQVVEFKNPNSRIEIGTDHDNYLHTTVLSKEVKEALAKDFK